MTLYPVVGLMDPPGKTSCTLHPLILRSGDDLSVVGSQNHPHICTQELEEYQRLGILLLLKEEVSVELSNEEFETMTILWMSEDFRDQLNQHNLRHPKKQSEGHQFESLYGGTYWVGTHKELWTLLVEWLRDVATLIVNTAEKGPEKAEQLLLLMMSVFAAHEYVNAMSWFLSPEDEKDTELDWIMQLTHQDPPASKDELRDSYVKFIAKLQK